MRNDPLGGKPEFRGTWHCLSDIVKKEGFSKLYTGRCTDPEAQIHA